MPAALCAEYVAALELLFQHLTPAERAERLAAALPLLEHAEAQHLKLLVRRDCGRVGGAMLLQALPGGMGVVWPPAVDPGLPDRAQREDELVAEAIAWLRAAGASMAQSLLATDELTLAEPLARNGFAHPTRLWYLRHNLELTGELLFIPHRISFESYVQCNRESFHQTLLRSYMQTLDFPELDGRRSLDDVLQSLQASHFDAECWWLAGDSAGPIGVVVTAVGEDRELLYTGVVPEARRRGYGMELVRHALVEAQAAGAHALTLSVDGRNEPALRLYRRMKFEAYGSREVFLALW
jgi:ribosomal protein S18 acetylase RimI-like enzyme